MLERRNKFKEELVKKGHSLVRNVMEEDNTDPLRLVLDYGG